VTEALAGGCTCCTWGSEVGQEYLPDADFPVGHLSGGTSFPTVASRLRVKLLLDPEVHNLWKCLTPSRISPHCICRERHAHLALKISLVTLSLPKLIGRLVLSSALSYIVPLFRAKSGAGDARNPAQLERGLTALVDLIGEVLQWRNWMPNRTGVGTKRQQAQLSP
jgi:hypothetical protein